MTHPSNIVRSTFYLSAATSSAVYLICISSMMMAELQNGIYMIERDQQGLLSTNGVELYSPAVLHPLGFSDHQKWEVINKPNGTVHFKVPGKSLYLSNLGDDKAVQFGQPVRLEETESSWQLLSAEDNDAFMIQTPMNHFSPPLVLDIGQASIFPAPLNLMPLSGPQQSWIFRRVVE
ncbi:hypothetical protein BG011_004142 [Mortierella polycephala]|uniref:Uncharacterized protein n=1 Tax=Mortierella polycephala TaxID=41804 RepID=A0A9P6Q2M4_9FUNG|nr:hypothetical protein BG011_004142 [Mortierella polycephala]